MRHIKTAFGLVVAVGALFAFAQASALAASASSNFNANIPGVPHRAITAEKPAKTSGRSEEPQEFKFGNQKLICQVWESGPEAERKEAPSALTIGKVEEELSTTLEVGIHFQKCGRVVRVVAGEPKKDEYVPANFKGKVTIIYHVNGFGEIIGNGEGEELEYGKGKNATIRETAATFNVAAGKLCRVIIPEQTVPIKAENEKNQNEEFSAAVYSNVFTPTARKGFVNNEKESLAIANNFKGLKYQFAEGTQCDEDEKASMGTTGTYKGELNLEIPTGNLGLEEKTEA